MDPSKPPGLGQQAPLTPEYQAVLEANLAKGKAGIQFDIKGTCGPVGMPRLMIMYEPMEIVIKPKVTYMLVESMSPIRRIYTDGRDFPAEPDPAFVGYSVGKWLDTDNDGTYDTLEIETRHMRGPRLSAFPSPATMKRWSRRSSISTRPIRTSCATRSPPTTTR
jgi:hypothetical protein